MGICCASCENGNEWECIEKLEIHVMVDHLEWHPYQCRYCQMVRLPTESMLRKHLSEAHPGQAVQVFRL